MNILQKLNLAGVGFSATATVLAFLNAGPCLGVAYAGLVMLNGALFFLNRERAS